MTPDNPTTPPADVARAPQVAFTAYNQAIEDAKAAIRGEKVDDPYAAATFINAIARKCSPHCYAQNVDSNADLAYADGYTNGFRHGRQSRLLAKETCPRCAGSGFETDGYTTCDQCGGGGLVKAEPNTRATPADTTERARRAALKIGEWLRTGDGEVDGNAIKEVAAIIAAEFGGGQVGQTDT